jgi:hypothetical protein
VYTVKSLPMHTFLELATLKVPSHVRFPKILLIPVQHLSMIVNVLAAAGDVFIAAILCTMLHRSKTGFKKWVDVLSGCVTVSDVIRWL